MKPNLILLFLCLFILACHSSPKQKNGSQKSSSINKTDSTNRECLDWDSVRLNGIIPMVSNYKYVVTRLGRPDSIGKLSEGVNGSYYHKKFRECYFKELVFEKYDDTLIFSEIDFNHRDQFYLKCDKLKLDNHFTSQEFKRLFPKSFEDNHLHGTSLDKYESISLPASLKGSDDDWIFTFNANTGKLLSIAHDDARDPKPR